MNLGTYLEFDGRPAIQFEREYPYPTERVWSAITEPSELLSWFPSSVAIELKVGGSIQFSDDPNLESMTGTVLACEPPVHLAYTWGGDQLHFQLASLPDDGCRLTLTNVLSAQDTAARNAAGWSVCLAELDKHLSGMASAGPHSDDAEPFQPYYDAYLAAGVPTGAPIPANTD
ncbi:MAG: toxin [Frankiales bacterium]|nr:toxin [Frankiales bacterium]